MRPNRDPKTIPLGERHHYTLDGAFIPVLERRSPWGPPVPGRAPHADQHIDNNGFGVPLKKEEQR